MSNLRDKIFTRFWVQHEFVSDRGPQFTGHEMANLCKTSPPVITPKPTSQWHIKTMIVSYVGSKHSNWYQWISEFHFTINAAYHETTSRIPAELALGRSLTGPLERLIGSPPNPQQTPYTLLEIQKVMLDQVKKRVEMCQSRQARY